MKPDLRKLAAGLALMTALGAGANAQEIAVDFDEKVDFTALSTFRVELATGWGNPLAEKRVVAELTEALEAKGWRSVPASDAQAIVLVHGATATRRTLETFYSGHGAYRWRGGFVTSTTSVREYTVGALVVDIFDASTKELVWRGVAQDELKDKPEKRDKQAAKAIDRMLRDFPPDAEKD